ncbi:deaminase [Desulfurispira natronophila]|uniref:Guanine deaminase n=1 Tax=Desulfurispira natronophila TaxID=682562 RepID=A0A7W7Y4W6_9BACT|nr:guanine deaminase [Desulfurispira natronophila]
MSENQRRFMQQAIELAHQSVDEGGGPFGAVVVRNDEVVGTGVNRVTTQNDPTAHAEVMAIRNACQQLQSFHLGDCDIYASCEPCPMCLGAVYWARLRRVFYGASRCDAAAVDFCDDFIYGQIPVDPSRRTIPFMQIMQAEAMGALRHWSAKADKVKY